MRKEELFEEILGQRCVIHYVVEGLSDEHRVLNVAEISEDQLLGEGNEGIFYFNWNGAIINKVDEGTFEISKNTAFLEIQFIKG